MAKVLSLTIRLYQKIKHVALPRTCRFTPSCSTYALQAIEKYGFFRGLIKAAFRVIRCSPLSPGGYDPLK